MATLPPCAIPPPVVNAQPAVVYSDGRTADYACVTGFKMSGSSRINCDNTTLQWYYSALPTCTVIDYSTTYPIWFYGLIAGFLGLLALMSVCCLLAYCCGWGSNSVSSLDGTQSSEGCCGRSRRRRRRSIVEDDDGSDGIYPTHVYVVPEVDPPVKEKAWMPHTHPIRKNNNITK